MQSVSSRIWTRVAMSISYDDNHYTMGTSIYIYIYICIRWAFETNEQVPLPQKQYLIYQKWYQFATSKGMDSYWWASSHMEVRTISFFQAAVVSILLYGCTTWMLTKHIEKKLDSNCTRILHSVLNKSCMQHPTKQQLHGYLLPTSKTIQVRWTRHAGHCWRSMDKLMSDVLLWTPSHGRAKLG